MAGLSRVGRDRGEEWAVDEGGEEAEAAIGGGGLEVKHCSVSSRRGLETCKKKFVLRI